MASTSDPPSSPISDTLPNDILSPHTLEQAPSENQQQHTIASSGVSSEERTCSSPAIMNSPTSSPLSSVAESAPSSPGSPLSVLSGTPSLPNLSPDASPSNDIARRYPSPMDSSASGTQSPLKAEAKPGRPRKSIPTSRPRSDKTADDGPPAKKRKIAQNLKERRTDYLDLTKHDEEKTDEDQVQLDRLMAALRKKKKIVVIAGAGMSVSANIPDFRSGTGLFAAPGRQQQKMKASGKHLFDASVYRHDASTESFHTMVREMHSLVDNAQPTPFHHMLAKLAEEKRLLRLYTQNIDCLDTQLEPLNTTIPLAHNKDNEWPKTVQLHGSLEKMVCTKCGSLEDFKAKLFEGAEAPLCEECTQLDKVRTQHAGKRSHGIGRLRPRFVLYNEYNPDEEAIGKISTADLKARPDAVLVVGTSLKVPGTRRLVKELCQVTRGRRDGFTAFINVDSEPKHPDFKDCWDLVVRAKCDTVAQELDVRVAVANAEPLSPPEIAHCDSYKIENRLEVQLPANPQLMEVVQSIPTPAPSPKPIKTEQVEKKVKQSTLSFAHAKEIPGSQGTKKQTKPRKPLKTSQPKNNVANAFKVVKPVSANDSTKAQKAGRKILPNAPSAKFSSNNVKTLDVAPTKAEEEGRRNSLPPLRPMRKDSTEGFIYTCTTPEDTSCDQGSYQHPSTPIQPQRPVSRDTISPKSVPKGMANIIDVE